ncbi:hypothetical protein RJ639_014472 [Escallonia herrerae]|uniref:Uncharacterized protein n=1 Tax=Escallonia herrerae TaxID=1293975 RepID=A0AA89AR57_9ASTE|nr:hypothetical protein RJ639_014472 [Escallonia herrerae]
MGDLCDIYEERRSGEDKNGLLIESGGAWRKLNVQRILDESTKNHVKMRTEEAERKLKSRKAIILDHGNASMKSQMKALAAAEANPWRMQYKQKKEPHFKKRKAEPPPVGGPPKSIYKSGLSSTTPPKGRPSASPLRSPLQQPVAPKGRPSPSPLRSPLQQSVAPASPTGTGGLAKGRASVDHVMPTQATSKENVTSSEKDMPGRVVTATAQDKRGSTKIGTKPADVRSLLISLLLENPKGMSVKALEKAVGDTVPNSVKQIEPILKRIAVFQAPGRYFLKPGVELESFKKSSSESGSSPEINNHQTPAQDDHCGEIHAPYPSPYVKDDVKVLGEQSQLNSKPREDLDAVEKIDISHHSPDLFGEKKVSDISEGPAGSSSDSGSDSNSESDSSDSGSDSGSHSRSRSRSRSKAEAEVL